MIHYLHYLNHLTARFEQGLQMSLIHHDINYVTYCLIRLEDL